MTEGRMIPVNTRTRKRIMDYLNEWHGDYWSLHTTEREGIAERIAENVLAYHRLLNRPLFVRVAQEMLNDGTIRITANDDGRLALEW